MTPLPTPDLVLVCLLVPPLVGLVGSSLFAVPTALALGVGSVPSLGILGYALFVEPPAE